MGNPPPRPEKRTKRSGARPAPTPPPAPNRTPLIIGVVVLVVAVVAIIVGLTSGNDDKPKVATSSSSSVLRALGEIPSSVFEKVGTGTSNNPPKAITDDPLMKDGKPHIAYVGAEFCPYCAAERWAMVVALGRFGSFTKLPLSHSAVEDVHSNTQTVTFRGAEYHSDVLAFSGTETAGNELVGGQYERLDTPPADVEAAATKHGIESIPFVDFGGKFLLSGATYDPGILAGKTSQQIADALSDPNSEIAKGIVGSANVLTAAICAATDNQPADVCKTPVIEAAGKQLERQR